ncbi:hypothetical protein NBO_34g0001 [Nosema bombycis CQ1]|uniref:Uncharacterized protein n=1 Tax=Nosema bombycis (strain CQ1 / CVCC 102059) TaxID=578461 RepID=R0KTK8_NOSB1|nr:hypothetical protein NBO_34g0001 [Nosema bombycis CQ1]|eukprot:EOB14151.1 hypothetical protein NBO_34g0001 [Nosema bombycis CQ1]
MNLKNLCFSYLLFISLSECYSLGRLIKYVLVTVNSANALVTFEEAWIKETVNVAEEENYSIPQKLLLIIMMPHLILFREFLMLAIICGFVLFILQFINVFYYGYRSIALEIIVFNIYIILCITVFFTGELFFTQ